MVYSRATTSAMALRPPLPAGFFAAGAIVCGEFVSWWYNWCCIRDASAWAQAQQENLLLYPNNEIRAYVLTEFLGGGLVDGEVGSWLDVQSFPTGTIFELVCVRAITRALISDPPHVIRSRSSNICCELSRLLAIN
jgi:hypothetical protein